MSRNGERSRLRGRYGWMLTLGASALTDSAGQSDSDTMVMAHVDQSPD